MWCRDTVLCECLTGPDIESHAALIIIDAEARCKPSSEQALACLVTCTAYIELTF